MNVCKMIITFNLSRITSNSTTALCLSWDRSASNKFNLRTKPSNNRKTAVEFVSIQYPEMSYKSSFGTEQKQ